ncbi:CRISPR-associated endonuclease Cas4g/Cas1g [Saccharopolyspora rosea]
METDPPSLPARAVSKYVYCPRLFHLERVQGYWRESEETRLGRHVHRTTDRGSGAEPGPGEAAELGWQTRSMSLASEQLGVSAVCDLVEGEAGSAYPVEYRRGTPRRDGRPWPAERAQLLLQILLLRENGYRCDRGAIWYAGSRRRVEVAWDEEADAEIRAQLDGARQVENQLDAPPPLVHSTQCPRCALLHVCAPDEINGLAGRDTEPPRRLLARDPDQHPLYVTEPGANIAVRRGRLVVTRDDEQLASVRLRDVLHLVIAGPVQLSTQAVHALAQEGAMVVWLSTGGWLTAVTTPGAGKHVELRRRQYTASQAVALHVGRQIVAGKVRNCRTLLRRNTRDLDHAVAQRLGAGVEQANHAGTLDSLLGIEGAAARTYFNALPQAFRSDHRLPGPKFDQTGRTRRPPRDPVSCLLSYLYALLIKDVTIACYALGFDPYVGLYHQPRYGRPALALDLAEEFRPLIADSIALTLVNKQQADAAMFDVHPTAVALTRTGRRTVINAYEQRLATEATHPVFGYKLSYRRALELQARLLAAYLLDKIPHYTPLTTR